ncbi:glycosyltransferase, partial [Francisella philomiragia]|uniref:glycosyltransferase n=1 Tax=Francisella philomiragia TaxID=28110 RepID=UPI001907CD99
MRKVVSIVLNHFTNDSRVLKENISLHKAGYKVAVVALYKEGLPEYESIDGIEVYRVKNWRSIQYLVNNILNFNDYLVALKNVAKFVNDLSPDIVHCNDLNELVVGVAVKKFFDYKVKIVYDSHEYQTEQKSIFYSKRCVRIYRLFERYCIKYADK